MKVKYVPCQPHCFAFGGFEVQMLATFDAVLQNGVNAEKLNLWSRDLDFDVVHVWGLEYINDFTISYAKKYNKKIVITALFPDFNTINRKLRHFASTYIGNAKFMKKMASLADAIVVVNSIEGHIANHYFGIPTNKLHYIPNIVNEKYYKVQNNPGTFHGLSEYVLCTGNICERKNQLNLVKACIEASIELVIIGKTIPGQEAYAGKIRKLIQNHENIIWIEGLKENSEELIQAYLHCSVFALPSLHEQGPISAYEAVTMGCKVLLADLPYANQSFFIHAKKVNPYSIKDISKGIISLLQIKENQSTASIMSPCLSNNVGLEYKKLYESLYL